MLLNIDYIKFHIFQIIFSVMGFQFAVLRIIINSLRIDYLFVFAKIRFYGWDTDRLFTPRDKIRLSRPNK